MASVVEKSLMLERFVLQRLVGECNVCLVEHRHCSSPMLRRCMCCSASNKHSQKLDNHHKTDLALSAQCSDHTVWPREHEADLELCGQDRRKLEVGTESTQRDQTQTNSGNPFQRGSIQDTD